MSSLSTARYIASSSLAATQVQVSVTSNNIANADTEGYTTKTASVSSSISAGSGAGVSVESVSSSVSKYLIEDLTDATSQASYATTTADYLSNLQTSLGTLEDEDGSGTSLVDAISDFEEAVTELATTPESTILASNAVSALEDLTSQIRDTADTVQGLIDDADSEVEAAVDTVNTLLETIDALNEQIRTATASGNSTADLDDQLTTAIVALSAYLDVTTFSCDDGSTKVYTSSGQMLVGSTAHFLTAGTDADGQTTISVNGSDITERLTGTDSKIGALLELRDETLPAYMDDLDELATTMIETLNAVDGLDGDILTGTGASDIKVVDSVLDDPTTLLGSGNASTTANNILDALQGDATYDEAGNLASGDRTFTEYATEIISTAVTASNSASDALDVAESALSSAEDAISSACGVNVDEETARLTELEQLYSLASTILSTLQEMFDDLKSAFA
ncbi:flagellar hook-associated protein FlgK [uncultured Cohaesibacter sp.]|uniref:flagellar hook-associated protein FlgK n=1 Tax=uncultured Cohaesibacter sp. TaxID=1002546 RepID=UPI0029C65B20|nr:flagellar hook-associated protein FlgK [uncultured Cohaesibacter sp.]